MLGRQKKSTKRQAEARSGSPTPKKKKDREVIAYNDVICPPFTSRLGGKGRNHADGSPWFKGPKKPAAKANDDSEDSE